MTYLYVLCKKKQQQWSNETHFIRNTRWHQQMGQLFRSSCLTRANSRYVGNRTVTRLPPHLDNRKRNKTCRTRTVENWLYVRLSCKTNMNIIKSAYYQAARASVNAFRTTPITNLLVEVNLPSIAKRAYELRSKFLPKLLNSTNSILEKDVTSAIRTKKTKAHQIC